MSVGVNNTSTTKTKGKIRFAKSLLTPTIVGNYAMSTATTNGYYVLSATALASIPGHPFAGTTSGATIGQSTVYIYNITKKQVQKVVIPLRFFVSVGDSVFFAVGATTPANASRWDTLGLTMPDSGDSMALSVTLQLDGARPVGGWKQTWTAT
jgi:hypothetical protein